MNESYSNPARRFKLTVQKIVKNSDSVSSLVCNMFVTKFGKNVEQCLQMFSYKNVNKDNKSALMEDS